MFLSQVPTATLVGKLKVNDPEKDLSPSGRSIGAKDIDLVCTASDPAFRRGSTTTIPDRTLGPYQAAIIFITNEIGIGILSLPAALNVLGLVPGILAIVLTGFLSLYSGYVLIQFYRRHPTVVNIVEYGRIIGGKPLEAVLATGFVINLVLICASAAITISIGLNTITENSVCTIGFIAFPVVVCWILCLPRIMKFVAWCGWPCTVSIVSAVMIVMIALGVSGPQNAPLSGIRIKAVGNPSFSGATSAFLNIAFAYTGNQAFPSVLAEMKDPSRDFPKALCIEKCFAIAMYVTVAVVCYCLAGDAITSPAIGSAPITVARISYGVLFISLFGTGLVIGHTATKYIHVVSVRQIRKYQHKKAAKMAGEAPAPEAKINTISSKATWTLWIGIGTAFWILTFVVANAIPVFNSLLNISSSILLVSFTWGLPAVVWLHLYWHELWSHWRRRILLALNLLMLAMTLFLNSGGLYASIAGLLAVFNDPSNSVDGPFSCGDNSIF